ncbi:hypothetical protein Hanom_Chr01g00056711 [Helianthus anomalus]
MGAPRRSSGRPFNSSKILKMISCLSKEMVQKWAENLSEFNIDGAIVGVKPAKYNRDGSKANTGKPMEHGSVFSRISFPDVQGQVKKTGFEAEVQHKVSGRSYSSVVDGSNIQTLKQIIPLPPMNTESRKNGFSNPKLENLEDVSLKYVGGLKVLLTFPSSKAASGFLDSNRDRWSVWFSNLEIWDGNFNKEDRIAWIRITGVLVCLWDRHVFNRIGERCGRVLLGSDVSVSDSDLSSGKMAILVHSGEKVCMEF